MSATSYGKDTVGQVAKLTGDAARRPVWRILGYRRATIVVGAARLAPADKLTASDAAAIDYFGTPW